MNDHRHRHRLWKTNRHTTTPNDRTNARTLERSIDDARGDERDKKVKYMRAQTVTMRQAMRATGKYRGDRGGLGTLKTFSTTRVARARAQEQEQQEQQEKPGMKKEKIEKASGMVNVPSGFRRGTVPVGLTSLIGRDFPSLMSSPFALTERMFDLLDFPSEFREMYEPFQRLMHRDSVSALPDKLPFAVNILEKKDAYQLTADLPGLNTKNVKVSVDSDKQLHIKALRESRHEEESDAAGVKIHAYERSFGSFDRKFQLPDSVDADAEDAIAASMKDGVLTVRIKKKPGPEPEPKPVERQIEIQST